MSMTERREPRERPDRPANRNHISPPTDKPDNGHEPLPLDNRPSIWATKDALHG
jgi:hypothetical protein